MSLHENRMKHEKTHQADVQCETMRGQTNAVTLAEVQRAAWKNVQLQREQVCIVVGRYICSSEEDDEFYITWPWMVSHDS